MIELIDSHAHLTSPDLYDRLPSLLERARDAGIGSIINICTDLLSLERGMALSEADNRIYQAAATTPHDVEKEGEEVFEVIAAHAREGKLIAIGETGLDYYYEHSPKEIQKTFLRRYLRLASECNLPVIIHCREAFADFFEILDEEYRSNGKHGPGVLHCFTGTVAEAEEVIERGWMLSLSGIVTFNKSTVLHEVARRIPLNRLLIETDAPYLAPVPHRGKQNEPSFLKDTAAFIASLRRISFEELAAAVTENTKALFKIP